MKKILWVIAACGLILVSVTYWDNIKYGLSFFCAGSYCNTVDYQLDCTYDELLDSIRSLKKRHPEYDVFRTDKDGKLKNIDGFKRYWYHFYFRLPFKDTTVIIHSLVREETDVLMCDGATFSPNFGSWTDLNNESDSLQVEILEVFEEKVVDELGIKRGKNFFKALIGL